MQRVEELLLQRGCPKVSLLVRSANRPALDRRSWIAIATVWATLAAAGIAIYL